MLKTEARISQAIRSVKIVFGDVRLIGLDRVVGPGARRDGSLSRSFCRDFGTGIRARNNGRGTSSCIVRESAGAVAGRSPAYAPTSLISHRNRDTTPRN